MPGTTYFVQECPTCGRRLEVRVEYLGKKIACRHCGARFEAFDASSGECLPSNSSLALLARAKTLIDTAAGSKS